MKTLLKVVALCLVAMLLAPTLPAAAENAPNPVKIVEKAQTKTITDQRTRLYKAAIVNEDNETHKIDVTLNWPTGVLHHTLQLTITTPDGTESKSHHSTDTGSLPVSIDVQPGRTIIEVHGKARTTAKEGQSATMRLSSGSSAVRFGSNPQASTLIVVHDAHPAALSGVDLLLIAGQSNVKGGFGTVELDAALQAILEAGRVHEVTILADGRLGLRPVLSLTQGLDFNHNPNPPSTGSVGFGAMLAALHVQATGRDVVVLPVGQKGSSVTEYGDEDRNWQRIERYVSWALIADPANRVVGMTWQQGESDIRMIAGDEPNADMGSVTDYELHLGSLIWRIDQTAAAVQPGHPTIPVSMGEVADTFRPSDPTKNVFANHMIALAGQWPRFSFVRSDGLTSNAGQYAAGDPTIPAGERTDRTHFSANAHLSPQGWAHRHHEALAAA